MIVTFWNGRSSPALPVVGNIARMESAIQFTNEDSWMEGGIRVLYVDDEPALLEITRIFLEKTGEFRVDTSISAKDALENHSIPSYDAIVSDYQMPEIDGIAFLKIIRDQFGSIPFILFTGRGREEVVIAAINNGADFYLQKGGDPKAQFAELTHKIRQVVLRKQAEASSRESESRFQQLVEQAPFPITLNRLDGSILFTNKKFLDIIGWTSEEAPNLKNWEKLAFPDTKFMVEQLNDWKKRVAIAINEGRTIEPITLPIREKSGEERIVEFSSVLFRDNVLIIGYDMTERIRAEKALKENAEKYRALVETSPDIIWEIDTQGIFRYVSPQIRTIMGYAPDEIVGRSIIDMIPEDERPYAIQEMKRVFSKGGPLPLFQVPVRHRDGHTLLFEIRPSLSEIPGNVEGYRGVAVDITERKNAEDALKRSEEKYRALVETSRDIVWEIDSKGTFRYVSPGVFTITGYTPEELLGKSLLDFVSEDRRADLMQELTRYGSLKRTQTPIEIHVHHRDGRVLTIEIRPALTETHDEMEEFRGIAVDITERKNTEDALKRSEEKYRALVETSPDIIWEIDREGKFQYVSPQVRAIMGFTPEELLGRSIADMVPEEIRPFMMREMGRMFSMEGTIAPFEVPTRHHDGHEMVIEIRPALTGTGDQREGFRGVAVDITERKRAEKAIMDANRQLKILGGITRHDILNKTTMVRGYLDLARMEVTNPGTAGLLENVESGLLAIQSQIEFTRLYENLGAKAPRWLSLDSVIPFSQVPESITLDADVKGVEVFADLILERVFSNLLDNSVRHGKHVKEIRVSSRQNGKDLVVVWEDNGIGIPTGNKEKIFERGFGENTGLGLFLAREILSLTGIGMKETGEEGHEARFEIQVPNGGFRVS